MTAFDDLRAALGKPYADEPYHVALERAEAEAVATREAAIVYLDALIRLGTLRGYPDFAFWVQQAHEAHVRLDAVRSRKRPTASTPPKPAAQPRRR